MAVNWNEVLTTVGGGAAVLVATAWLIRTVISSGLAREAEAFRIKLEANSNTEIERLKNALQITAEEHRVRYSKLHEDRARRIADLYERIVNVSVQCERYITHPGGEDDRNEEFNNLQEQFRELILFMETSKIYLPPQICELLEKSVKGFRNPIIKLAINERAYPERMSEKAMERRNEVMMEAFTAMEKDMPAAREALVVEFRKLLGVSG